jgi:hypothetical protein
MALPEVDEEEAWVGTRWTVRKRNFAHIVFIADGWPPAYAAAAGSGGPQTVLTFRSAEAEALGLMGPPYFRPVWFPDIVGVRIDSSTDWDEITELVTDSYRRLAPARLVRLLDAPR